MADVERERVTALWREAAAALSPDDDLAKRMAEGLSMLAECGRLREHEQVAHDEGYDEGQARIWDAPVCSVCGADHDADESAMCERGKVVSFREWVDECGRLREQLDAARKALKEITRTPYRDWHLNARIARAALGVEGEQEKPQ